MGSISCTSQKTTDMHIRGTAYQPSERQAKLPRKAASVNEQLSSYYASPAATRSGSDSAVYCRENRAQKQSDIH